MSPRSESGEEPQPRWRRRARRRRPRFQPLTCCFFLPCRYWTSEAERAGKSPFQVCLCLAPCQPLRCFNSRPRLTATSFPPLPQDPLAIIGILAILGPFLILGVAIATGLVDLTAGR